MMTLADPVFGQVWSPDGVHWHGKVTFLPVSREIDVMVTSDGDRPGDRERATFLELCERYNAMLPTLAEALYELYMPDKGGARNQPPDPSGPADMLSLTQLGGVVVGPGDTLRLFLGFVPGAAWDEATFTIRVVNWQPIGESLRD
jgi:hypothetical protein